MEIFATEFPVRAGMDRARLSAEVVAWLRGMKASTILDRQEACELNGDNVQLNTDSETLLLRAFEGPDRNATGFRHEIVETGMGRRWRTEGVATYASESPDVGILRLRTQCLAETANAVLEPPKKPYLIKTLLREGWGANDGLLYVGAEPLYLSDDTKGLTDAAQIFSGEGSVALPILYVSAAAASETALSDTTVRTLAFELGGVAHIVVEPSRAFSFNLKERLRGRNVYGGAVGVVTPGHGLVQRLMLGPRYATSEAIARAAADQCRALRRGWRTRGWDWSDLLENALRAQRRRDTERRGAEQATRDDQLALEALYQEEIASLEEKLRERNDEIERLASELSAQNANDQAKGASAALDAMGPELYPEERFDRIRMAIQIALAHADSDGLDNRSRRMFEALLAATRQSTSLVALKEEIAAAGKNTRKLASEMARLFRSLRFDESADGKHLRLSPPAELVGLTSLTVPKTPSDNRSGRNCASQAKAALGITKL